MQKIKDFGSQLITEIIKNIDQSNNQQNTHTLPKNENQESNTLTFLNKALDIISRNIAAERHPYSRTKNMSLMVIDALEFYLEEGNETKVTTKNLHLKSVARLAESTLGNSTARDSLRSFSNGLIKFILEDSELSSALGLAKYLEDCKKVHEANLVQEKKDKPLNEDILMTQIQLSSRICLASKKEETLSMEELSEGIREIREFSSRYDEEKSGKILRPQPVYAEKNSSIPKLIKLAQNIIRENDTPESTTSPTAFSKFTRAKQMQYDK